MTTAERGSRGRLRSARPATVRAAYVVTLADVDRKQRLAIAGSVGWTRKAGQLGPGWTGTADGRAVVWPEGFPFTFGGLKQSTCGGMTVYQEAPAGKCPDCPVRTDYT